MANLTRVREWSESHMDVALDIVRIYLGVGLLLKGLYFMGNTSALIELMDQSGNMWFAPAAVAHYIISAHLIGGALLIVGLFTRLAAIFQIPILLGAVFWIYMPRMVSIGMREDVEFSALVLFLLLVISIYGAGRWSLDHMMSKRVASRWEPRPA